jgi:hypothetical protein
MGKITIEYLWKDRKRFLGMPLSFTRYRLSEDRLFLSVGFFSIRPSVGFVNALKSPEPRTVQGIWRRFIPEITRSGKARTGGRFRRGWCRL